MENYRSLLGVLIMLVGLYGKPHEEGHGLFNA